MNFKPYKLDLIKGTVSFRSQYMDNFRHKMSSKICSYKIKTIGTDFIITYYGEKYILMSLYR